MATSSVKGSSSELQMNYEDDTVVVLVDIVQIHAMEKLEFDTQAIATIYSPECLVLCSPPVTCLLIAAAAIKLIPSSCAGVVDLFRGLCVNKLCAKK